MVGLYTHLEYSYHQSYVLTERQPLENFTPSDQRLNSFLNMYYIILPLGCNPNISQGQRDLREMGLAFSPTCIPANISWRSWAKSVWNTQ